MADAAVAPRRAHLSLGGNIGDVAASFASAIGELNAHVNVRVSKRSSLWRTKPWGIVEQSDFLNMAIEVESTLEADALLDLCLAIEAGRGRVRDRRWGPRTLDIDIIAYGGLVCETGRLTLPHPRAHERGFVLAPLCEITPDVQLGERTAAQWLQALSHDADGWVLDLGATQRLEALLPPDDAGTDM